MNAARTAPATASDLGPSCGPEEHCITCGDQAIPMRVLGVEQPGGLAICRELSDVLQMTGIAGETVDVGLLADVSAGDVVLVHAGTALARLGPEEVEA